jgi:hypothetical protein
VIAWLFGVALAATSGDVAIAGSAWTLSVGAGDPALDRQLRVLASIQDCRNGEVPEADVPLCLPAVDPVKRTLRLGIQMRASSDDAPLPAAISPSRLKVSLQTAGGVASLGSEAVTLIGHDPLPGEQLVILVVDRSGSMYEGKAGDEPMVRVVRALLQPATRDKLLPVAERSGVMLLAFTDSLTAMVTRAPEGSTSGEPGGAGPAGESEVMVAPERYSAAVRRLLQEDGGYTHLFDAVQGVLDEVLIKEHVQRFIARTESDPVVVLITDGFNNSAGRETCGDNAAPLVSLLQNLRTAQSRAGYAPVLHTVGFGRAYQPDYELIADDNALTGALLCGADQGRRIDNDLEKDGIDNPTLAYLARAGGGESLVTEDPLALARFLLRAGSPRHRWYELQIALPEDRQLAFRSRLPLRVDVLGVQAAHAEATFIPNPLLDLPGVAGRAAVSLVALRVLGVSQLVLLLLVAGYHLRRAVARRGAVASRPGGG